jgi:ubiquitin-conjugating enzyme E2 G1
MASGVGGALRQCAARRGAPRRAAGASRSHTFLAKLTGWGGEGSDGLPAPALPALLLLRRPLTAGISAALCAVPAPRTMDNASLLLMRQLKGACVRPLRHRRTQAAQRSAFPAKVALPRPEHGAEAATRHPPVHGQRAWPAWLRARRAVGLTSPAHTTLCAARCDAHRAPALRVPRSELTKNPVEGFSAGLVDDSNPFKWEVMIMGPPDTPYEGGFFQATMTFPTDYPNLPPDMRFVSEFWHPNVYQDGRVCISILHAPGDDQYGYEKSSERWRPIHSIESIIVSVIAMIASPNDESPANIDAAVRAPWRRARARHRHHHPYRRAPPRTCSCGRARRAPHRATTRAARAAHEANARACVASARRKCGARTTRSSTRR